MIGSGIGGLACACALTRCGLKVDVLEQHFAPGGLTQTFSRNGFTWDVGVHYIGQMHDGGAARGVLDWLCDGAIEFSPTGPVYDTVHRLQTAVRTGRKGGRDIEQFFLRETHQVRQRLVGRLPRQTRVRILVCAESAGDPDSLSVRVWEPFAACD